MLDLLHNTCYNIYILKEVTKMKKVFAMEIMENGIKDARGNVYKVDTTNVEIGDLLFIENGKIVKNCGLEFRGVKEFSVVIG